MSHFGDPEDADQIETPDSDGDTLYRLPTSSEHSDGSDDHRDGVENHNEVRSHKTKKRNPNKNVNVDSTALKGPNSLHTNEGVPGDSSDRPSCRERLSWTRRSEMPKEKTVIAEVHKKMQTNLSPPFDDCSNGGRQQYIKMQSKSLK